MCQSVCRVMKSIVLTVGLYSVFRVAAYNQNYEWQPDPFSDSKNLWSQVAISGTGQYVFLTAQKGGGGIWVSNNFGVSFTSVASTPSTENWGQICVSYDGQYSIAAITSGSNGVYYSTNYGGSYTQSSFRSDVYGLTCDSSGQFVTVGLCSGAIYYSTNYGASFSISNSPSSCWYGIASSASGQYQVAVSNTLAGIYLSSDTGQTWQATTTSYASYTFRAVTSDYTGQYLAATSQGAFKGVLYSVNGGASWQTSTINTDPELPSIASNSSGTLLAVAAYNSGIYFSTNHGQSWTLTETSYQHVPTWGGVALNADGSLAMAVDTQLAYACWYAPPPTVVPTTAPTVAPTYVPTEEPSVLPSVVPSVVSTFFPSSTPSVEYILPKDDDGYQASVDGLQVFCISIPGMLLLFLRLLSMYSRRVNDVETLNQLHSNLIELGESLLSSLNVILALNTLVYAYEHKSRLVYAFLLASRLVTLIVSVVFVSVYFAPVDHRTASSSTTLSLMLNHTALSKGIPVYLCHTFVGSIPMRSITAALISLSVFDLTIIRLLPWSRSDFTNNVQGYPSMFTVRLCLYGTLISMALQTAASSVDLMFDNSKKHHHTAWEYLFMLFCILNLMVSIASVLLLMQSAHMRHLETLNSKTTADGDNIDDDDVDVEMNKSVVSRGDRSQNNHGTNSDDEEDSDIVLAQAVVVPNVISISDNDVTECGNTSNITHPSSIGEGDDNVVRNVLNENSNLSDNVVI